MPLSLENDNLFAMIHPAESQRQKIFSRKQSYHQTNVSIDNETMLNRLNMVI